MTVERHRHERVAEEIRHEISAMLAGELKDPRVACPLTVNDVRVTPDLKHARIFVTVYGSSAERADARKGLEAASGYVRRELTHRLQIRRVPELHFVLDSSAAESDRIDELLRRAASHEESST